MSEIKMDYILKMYTGETYECTFNLDEFLSEIDRDKDELEKIYYANKNGSIVCISGDELAHYLYKLTEE